MASFRSSRIGVRYPRPPTRADRRHHDRAQGLNEPAGYLDHRGGSRQARRRVGRPPIYRLPRYPTCFAHPASNSSGVIPKTAFNAFSVPLVPRVMGCLRR